VSDVAFREEHGIGPGDAPLEYELPRDGRVRLTVRLGERRTGGHGIRVRRITRDGPTLTLRCEITAPRDGAMLAQALTYPAQTVSVDDGLVRGVRAVVLVDQSGVERARITA
jgi:protease stability complex PrcB-like protein